MIASVDIHGSSAHHGPFQASSGSQLAPNIFPITSELRLRGVRHTECVEPGRHHQIKMWSTSSRHRIPTCSLPVSHLFPRPGQPQLYLLLRQIGFEFHNNETAQ
jgi:hypothetical protein